MFRLLLFMLVPTVGWTQIPPGYYSSAQGLTGEPLRTALFNIIDNHTVLNYSDLWTHFPNTDDNSGLVWDMYTDVPSGTPTYTFTFGADQCGTYSAEGDCYNREHSVPQSWFNGASPMYSDLFQIYPVDGYVNGQRSNWPYGEVSSPSYTSSNGSRVGPCSYPGCSGTVFEPIDEYKGDFARTYFYMMTRYKNNVSSWNSGMFASDNLSNWAENMLLDWDDLDPVDQKEIDRNEAIYAVQGNRNPFIDVPGWVEYIWGPIASVDEQVVPIPTITSDQEGLIVNHPGHTPISIEILDVMGRSITDAQIEPGVTQISLSSVKGVFLVRFTLSGQLHTLKFVR